MTEKKERRGGETPQLQAFDYKGSSLAGGHPPPNTTREEGCVRAQGWSSPDPCSPPKPAARSRLDYRRVRSLRLRASGRPRRATAPPRRGPARGALRFSGPVLGRAPLGAIRPRGASGDGIGQHVVWPCFRLTVIADFYRFSLPVRKSNATSTSSFSSSRSIV
jgi:hypothetical protein